MNELLSSALDGSFTFANVAITLGVALILGIGFSFTYMFVHRKNGFKKDFIVTIAILPIIIATIIMLISHIWKDSDSTTATITKALSFAGVFAIVRFRSEPANPKDMIYVFSALAVGLGCGLGYIGFCVLACIFIMIVMICTSLVRLGEGSSQLMTLRIMIPEDLSYEEQFADLFVKYTNFAELVKVKTSEFGSLYTVTYNVKLKDSKSTKAFIDELRTRNGNLNIFMTTFEASN